MTKREIILEWLKAEHRKEKKRALRAIAYYEVRFDADDDVDDALDQIHMIEMMLLKAMNDDEWLEYINKFGFIDPRLKDFGIESQEDVNKFVREIDIAMKRPTIVTRNSNVLPSNKRAHLRSV